MTAETITKLNTNGLTVVKTSDHHAMLRQLARLAQFERLMLTTAAGNPPVELAVEHVRLLMDIPAPERQRPPLPRFDPATRMNLEDIPQVIRAAYAGLYTYFDHDASLLDPAAVPELIDGALEISRSGRTLNDPEYLRTGFINATVCALVGVISIDRLKEEIHVP